MENTSEETPQNPKKDSKSLAAKAVVCAFAPVRLVLITGYLLAEGVTACVDPLVDKVTDGVNTIKDKVADAVGDSEIDPEKKEKLAAAAQIAGGVYSGLSGILMIAGRGFMGSFAKRHHMQREWIAKAEFDHAQKSIEEGMKRWKNAPKN